MTQKLVNQDRGQVIESEKKICGATESWQPVISFRRETTFFLIKSSRFCDNLKNKFSHISQKERFSAKEDVEKERCSLRPIISHLIDLFWETSLSVGKKKIYSLKDKIMSWRVSMKRWSHVKGCWARRSDAELDCVSVCFTLRLKYFTHNTKCIHLHVRAIKLYKLCRKNSKIQKSVKFYSLRNDSTVMLIKLSTRLVSPESRILIFKLNERFRSD